MTGKMAENKLGVTFVFRSPVYPAIVISRDELIAAFGPKSLVIFLLSAPPPVAGKNVIMIDSTGEEFWYIKDLHAVTPGFFPPRWTKKRIIELYNESTNARNMNQSYPMRSLSSKKLSRIITEICQLIRRS